MSIESFCFGEKYSGLMVERSSTIQSILNDIKSHDMWLKTCELYI